MSSSSSNPNKNSNNNVSSPSSTHDRSSAANTTFVQTDPSAFRAVVQKLTGASPDPSTLKLPVTVPGRISADMGMAPRRPVFKLHERRQSARKLEITLNGGGHMMSTFGPVGSPATRQRCFGGEMVMASPVSPLELLFGRGSPRSPAEEEERAIAEKGFYLHPSPLSTPRGSDPELLPLFPLNSPGADSSSCS